MLMNIIDLKLAQKTYPTGDPKFSVMQAFPAAITAEEADPFLMLDHFGPTKSTGRIEDPDKFQVGTLRTCCGSVYRYSLL